MQRKERFPWKWIGLAIVIIALLISVRVLPVTDCLTRFNYWVADLGVWGVLLFILVYIVATVLFFPASILTIGAGFIFGVLLGTMIVWFASTEDTAMAFLNALYLVLYQLYLKIATIPWFQHSSRTT